MSAIVEASDLGRRYRHGVAQSGPRTWRTLLSNRRPGRGLRPVWALRHVSFTLDQGRSLGLVGPNGAGKSTLLRLLGGIGLPDEGQLHVDGRVAGMFELGQDFHPDLTGRDNIRTAGLVAGFSRREIQGMTPSIVQFADLGRFIDSPVRVYSSGMKARLAFAVAIHVEPEILLIDEVLAVGDVGFQRRCYDRLRDLRTAGVTIVLASHSVDEVRELCDEVIWLRGGRLIASGPPGLVLERYAEITAQETRLVTPSVEAAPRTSSDRLRLNDNRFGTLEATIDDVRIQDSSGHECASIPCGAFLRLVVNTSIPDHVGPVTLSVKLVRHRDGLVCLDTSTRSSSRGFVTFMAEFERLDLASGDYAFDVGLFSHDWDRTFDLHQGAYGLRVTSSWSSDAVVLPPIGWTVTNVSSSAPGGDPVADSLVASPGVAED